MSTSSVVMIVALAIPALARADVSDDEYITGDAPALDYNTGYRGDPPCFDSSDVLGYRRCPAYGRWGRNLLGPYVTIGFGVNVRHLPLAEPPVLARTTMSQSITSPSTDVLTVDERFRISLTHVLYMAVDFEFGAFAGEDSRRRLDVVDGLASLGVRAGVGPLSLSGELAGGGLAYSAADLGMQGEIVLEARGRADLWVTPWFTLGGLFGVSVLRANEWVAGVALGFHSYSFGGER